MAALQKMAAKNGKISEQPRGDTQVPFYSANKLGSNVRVSYILRLQDKKYFIIVRFKKA